MTASRDQPAPALSEVTPSLYPTLSTFQKRLTDAAYARIVAGKPGIYTGPLDTPRRRAQLAYTYGFYRYTAIVVFPFAALTGGLFALMNPIAAACAGVALIATVIQVLRMLRCSSRQNAYFRGDTR